LFFPINEKKINESSSLDSNFSLQETPNYALLNFIHNNSCILNGEVFLGNYSIGFSTNGSFNLSRKEYDSFWNEKISLKGITSSCFEENSNLPFAEHWTIEDLEYYFQNNEASVFTTNLNPRWPSYPEAMQGFIRPSEVEGKLSKMNINLNNSDWENIDKIFEKFYLGYVSDISRFNELEYWQTPSEVMKNKGGDCEDWAVYLTSILRAYNLEVNCYSAVWSTHVNVLCQRDTNFVIYDQDRVRTGLYLDKELILQDNQVNIRSWRNNYFKHYGIPPDQQILFYLINEEEIIEFEDGKEDFVEWILERGELKK